MTDIGTPIMPGGEDVLDFCAVGAMVHRLDSGIMPMRKATELKVRCRLVRGGLARLHPLCAAAHAGVGARVLAEICFV
jgi:hypothetical protein